MASCPITLWEIDQKTVETVADFIFLGSKITADGDCNCRSLQMVKLKDAWNDFSFFEFTKARLMAQNMIYPAEGSVCT